ncbi:MULTISPECIES: hypothetical protein [unclassified Fibrobacter]|uniref:hypothetical protein n=1 Tax=unclassified Fibrobacter TaxID=2634177 RepID=UPI000B52909F|nr:MULTISPECIES: hypothetical protein [Fibrobacter]MCL4102511.1 hypothetical protein [Fibrobacter succinogenes]MCQ2100043.1 hypothetical protein [Fibrobacter sp.]OWV13548.1 hypothetical protein B7992_08305 [Fibrobacter sp. UWH1]
MATIGFDEQIEQIVKQLTEKINMAISFALDESKSFEQAEAIFNEAITVLEYYQCGDTAAEQLINFSKITYFRKECRKALLFATDAVEKSVTDNVREKASNNLHDMAFKLLEYIVINDKGQINVTFDDVQSFLVPQDYCNALQKAYEARNLIKTKNDLVFVTNALKKLSMEVLRQGLRQEKDGHFADSLSLLKNVLPFLNVKRAEIVNKEIEKMEGISNAV